MDVALLGLGVVLCGAASALAWLLGAARARAAAETRLREADTRLREAEARASAAGARAEALADQARDAGERLAILETTLRQVDSRRAAEAARAEALARNLADQRELLDTAKAQLGDTFQALAADTLRATQEGFLTLASERLGAVRKETTLAIEGMVAPVRSSLEKVDVQIQAMERERGSAYGSLKQQMHAIAETQEKLQAATGSLVSALKAPSVRGQWGEMQLRRVVELAGMVDHCDFHQQVTVDGEDGRLRPDMVVRLPGGRNIVVDAKAPMAAYLEAREAPTEAARLEKLRQHAAQVRGHITKLSAKSYWEQLEVAPEVVVMFLPGESLYSAALEQMPGLIEEGFAQKVLVATPTTLLGLLRAVSYGWREERLAENAQRISEEGRRLHERVATVLEHFADLGRALGQSVKHFNAAMVSFDRRVVVSARKLEELDAKGKKELDERAQIDARPFTVSVDQEPAKQEPAKRRLATQQPVLTLALSSADDGT
jgi:DNA recombination protein RmuC